jgi:hypothetical protein
MSDFFNRVSQNTIGKLADIEQRLDNLKKMSDDERATLTYVWDMMNGYQQEVREYNTQLEDSTTLSSQIPLIVAARKVSEKKWAEFTYRYFDVMEQIQLVRLPVVEAIKAANATIQPLAQWEKNEQIVNDIYLNTYAVNKTTLTTAQAQTIANVAFQCYLEGGTAVLRARTLFQGWRDYAFSTYDFCGKPAVASSPEVINGKVVQNHTTNEISIYPNPAQSELNVVIPQLLQNESATITIISVTGKFLLDKRTLNINNTLDISHLANGLYICNIIKDKAIIASQKLIIIK